jgi:hypothetical protein
VRLEVRQIICHAQRHVKPNTDKQPGGWAASHTGRDDLDGYLVAGCVGATFTAPGAVLSTTALAPCWPLRLAASLVTVSCSCVRLFCFTISCAVESCQGTVWRPYLPLKVAIAINCDAAPLFYQPNALQ